MPRHADQHPRPEVEETEPATAALLRAQLPVPAADFREDLRRQITSSGPDGGRAGVEPSVKAQLATYVLSGAVLLALAAVGLGGAGPFAA
jgi:hypothetical protein